MLLKQLMALATALFFTFSAQASENCFIAKENGRIIKKIGRCDQRRSPYSTFKIPLALMGFDSGILKTPQKPVIQFSAAIKQNLGSLYDPEHYPIMLLWSRDQTPTTWMKYSVVWYSQEITKTLGMEKLKDYVDKFNYGNRDVSGTPGKNDGLKKAWINSSLEIKPLEMMAFIEQLSKKALPVSQAAQENTIKIIELENLWDDWHLYGKTGGGMENGWFVGWTEKKGRRIAFVQYIEQKNSLISAGRVAKELAKDNLIGLIEASTDPSS